MSPASSQWRAMARCSLLALWCGASAVSAAASAVTITAPSSVVAGQAGYAASVPAQTGAGYSWSIVNGSILVGASTRSVAFAAGASGAVTLSCTVTAEDGSSATGTLAVPITPATPPRFNLDQALTDRAQGTTLGFSGLGMLTGNLEAQSFFPPGKVADYWGFQYLRDNDPDDMGHNTSFLTRVACNVLSILDDEQFGQLRALAASQVAEINRYAYERYPLMRAFRRLVDGDVPAAATGLDVEAVKAASRELYRLDGRISFDRALLYARVFRTFSAEQKSYLGAMAGRGWRSWPDRTMDDVRERMRGLSHDESVAVMTYAGDLFSWYVGSIAADVYFCPERHGTYFGSFYMKDAPAIGHEGYGIDESLTGRAGAALVDPAEGYVTAEQAAIVAGLVGVQRDNLYAGSASIVTARTAISTALRSLIRSSEPSAEEIAQVRGFVLEQSALYGELDGENNAAYASAFARVNASLSAGQKDRLLDLRRSFLAGTYADGTPFDFTVCTTFYLFGERIPDPRSLAPFTADTGYLFAAEVGCTPSATDLCIDGTVPSDRRFRIEATWGTVQAGGLNGPGYAVATAPIGLEQGGMFWFFDAANPEMLVKVLDGCGVNSRFWVFAAAGTNVRLVLKITDTLTGRVNLYLNPDLTAAPPVQDVEAFPCEAGDPEARPGSGSAFATAPSAAEVSVLASGSEPCIPSATELCLDGAVAGDRRFRVEVDWDTVQGGGLTGQGIAVPAAPIGLDRGGLFWFFAPTNPEMLVKVLDGCGVNSRFWVYWSAGTNVGLAVRVTDTTTGIARVYSNGDLTVAAPVQDVSAFDCE